MIRFLMESLDYHEGPRGLLDDVGVVMRFTRNWIHYGWVTHVVVCVLLAAAQGLAR